MLASVAPPSEYIRTSFKNLQIFSGNFTGIQSPDNNILLIDNFSPL